MFSFDTNILAYASDIDAGTRYDQAKDLIHESANADAWLNHQSLVEFLRFSVYKKKQALSEANRFLLDWRAAFPTFAAGDDDLSRTIGLLGSYNLSVWDAYMLAVCAVNGCEVLLSEDMKDGELYGSVRVLNPFNARNVSAMTELLSQ
jgi:predicted nucleic acid-binding protein